jgi:hypothetical protein
MERDSGIRQQIDTLEIERTPLFQLRDLRAEVMLQLEKINILNTMFLSVDPTDIKSADFTNYIALADALKGIANYAERVSMGRPATIGSVIQKMPASDLKSGDTVVYRTINLGPQNLKVVKSFGITDSGKYLFEMRSLSPLHGELPVELKFLELAPTHQVELITDKPIEHTEPDINLRNVSGQNKQDTLLSRDPETWDYMLKQTIDANIGYRPLSHEFAKMISEDPAMSGDVQRDAENPGPGINALTSEPSCPPPSLTNHQPDALFSSSEKFGGGVSPEVPVESWPYSAARAALASLPSRAAGGTNSLVRSKPLSNPDTKRPQPPPSKRPAARRCGNIK